MNNSSTSPVNVWTTTANKYSPKINIADYASWGEIVAAVSTSEADLVSQVISRACKIKDNASITVDLNELSGAELEVMVRYRSDSSRPWRVIAKMPIAKDTEGALYDVLSDLIKAARPVIALMGAK